MQVLNNILTVVDQLLENSTTKVLGSAQIQHPSSSNILQVLDNFVKVVDGIYTNQTNETFDLRNLKTELPNVAFSISKDLFTHDVFLITILKSSNVSVNITTDSRKAKITSNTLSVIQIPKETFAGNPEKPETLYSYCFTKPNLFLSIEELQTVSGNKTSIDQVVDSIVVSASILARRIENLSNPVILTFKKSDQQIEDEKLDCQFWNKSYGKFL